jgi:hypothetical protein
MKLASRGTDPGVPTLPANSGLNLARRPETPCFLFRLREICPQEYGWRASIGTVFMLRRARPNSEGTARLRNTTRLLRPRLLLSDTCCRTARTACLRCQPVIAHRSSRMRPFSARLAATIDGGYSATLLARGIVRVAGNPHLDQTRVTFAVPNHVWEVFVGHQSHRTFAC